MICKKAHRYLPNLAQLPDSQAGDGRHMCAGCAYEQGYTMDLKTYPKISTLTY